MNCPRCKTPDVEGSRFCRSCGQQISNVAGQVESEASTKPAQPLVHDGTAGPGRPLVVVPPSVGQEQIRASAPPTPAPGLGGGPQAVLLLPDGRQFPLTRGEVLIGRSSAADLTINEDHVSRRHARIVAGPSGFLISDLGSSNGTYVNNVRVRDSSEIRDQDVLKIGRTAVIFRLYGLDGVPAGDDFHPAVVVEARHLTKTYGHGATQVMAVNNVNLTVTRGRIELIMGPSGSGKTTLLSMLGCLLRPTSGHITINTREVTALPERALPQVRLRNIGFIFQSFNLLSSLTALENVIFPLTLAGVRRRPAVARSKEMLTRLGMGERLNFMPAKLSGGEQQRVAIARALVNEPTLILADEPTGNLDSKSGHAVMEILYRIAKEQDRSVIIVSHDPRIKDIADRILWLEDGELSLGDHS